MKKHLDQNGFSALHALLALIIIGIVGFTGWYVWNANQKADDNLTANNSSTSSLKKNETAPVQNGSKENIPNGWVQYKDASTGVSFYHPAAWKKDKLQVHKTPVSETVKGTNHGPYSAKFIFKKTENKWYVVDFEGNQVKLDSRYETVSTIPASTYPAVYGYAGEGGGVSYYAAFTDGTSSYLIELPLIFEEDDPKSFNEQKKAITDLIATIKIDS